MALRLTALTVLAALAPGLALAADLPTRKAPVAPPVAPAADSGFYAGAFAGAEFGGLTTSPGSAQNAWGFSTGTLLGYKWRFSPWTFGVEGDISSNTMTQKFSARGGFPATQIDSVYSIHARGRLGYQMGDFEPFLAGGFVWSEIAQQQQSPTPFVGASSLRPGWTLGGGVDAHFALPLLGQSTIRAEYLYDKLQSTDLNLGGVVYRTGGAEQYARIGLIKYFGADRALEAAPVVADWSGNYFGVIGGYEGARYSTSVGGFDAKGGTVGVYTGRNWMFGQAMLGFDGSTAFGGINGDGAQPGAASTHVRDYFLSDIRGRAGWAFGRWLPYAAAGVKFDTSSQRDPATGNYRGDVLHTSGTIGAGLEYMLTDRLALRGEYAYAHAFKSTQTKLDFDNCCSQSRDSQSVRFGLGYFLR
jgi:outer membrane immunogenic protein